MTEKKRELLTIYAGIGVLVVIVFSLFYISEYSLKMSSDPQIRTLQKEAMELRIYPRARELRENAKELFGWRWDFYGETDYTENNVTFRGTDGYHEIEYQALFLKWRDWENLIIFYEGSRVFEAKMRFNKFFGEGSLNLKEITAFVKGPWIGVFDEMYAHAIKGPPTPPNGKAELKKNWGIG